MGAVLKLLRRPSADRCLAEEYSTVWTDRIFHPSAGGHLGCFHLLTVMNSAMNIHVQAVMGTQVSVSLGDTPKSGIAGPRGNS